MYRERGTEAEIHCKNISHNLSQFKKLHAGKIIAVVKADAYGHGLSRVVPHLSHCDAFAVATMDEAIELRAINTNKRIILLEGIFNEDELQTAITHHFDVVVHQHYQIELLQTISSECRLDVWFKIDTGMNRLGFDPSEAVELLTKLSGFTGLGAIRIMTHFASSDDKTLLQTKEQIKLNQWVKSLTYEYSLSNTAAVLNQISDRNEWVRVGIGLFGVSPLPKQWAEDFGLKPVMQLKAKIIATKTIKAGSLVGYGGTYTAEKDTRIGIVGIGYADGYPWTRKQSHVVVENCKIPVIGRVSMDMMAVDLTAVETVVTGHVVEVWGDQMPIEAVAAELDLIPYALTCGITKRVKFHDVQ
jgi:alanine racemase